jgi:hypothetical protein
VVHESSESPPQSNKPDEICEGITKRLDCRTIVIIKSIVSSNLKLQSLNFFADPGSKSNWFSTQNIGET